MKSWPCQRCQLWQCEQVLRHTGATIPNTNITSASHTRFGVETFRRRVGLKLRPLVRRLFCCRWRSFYCFLLLSFLSVLRSANHLEHFLIRVYELHIYPGMTTRENTENFVRKCLPDLVDILKIEDHR